MINLRRAIVGRKYSKKNNLENRMSFLTNKHAVVIYKYDIENKSVLNEKSLVLVVSAAKYKIFEFILLYQALVMKLALLVILSVVAGIKCAGDAVESPSTAHPHPSSKQLTATQVRVGDNDSCGRRQIKETELSAEGVDAKTGYWPWHVQVLRLQRKVYGMTCGGTLVTKSWVMTAAHCLVIGEIVYKPYSFMVTMGSYYSYGYHIADVVVHDDFKITQLKNDIGFLKLEKEVTFDDYIQPACVWHDKISEKLSTGEVFGNVVGWVFEGTQAKLRDLSLPMVPEATCVKSDPEYYTKIVDNRNFCAGLSNDTVTWYGESGSAFHVFVPDDKSKENGEGSTGAWYVRGILSQSPTTDDASPVSQQYAVFTDVAKYDKWIQKLIS